MRNLPMLQLRSLSDHVMKLRLPAKSAVYWQGEKSGSVFLVCEGSVKLVRVNELGVERIG